MSKKKDVWYFLTRDDDGHWYVIQTNQKREFERWMDAMAESKEWTGHNFNDDAIGGSPSNVSFPTFLID